MYRTENLILELADGPRKPGDTVVAMKWLTPTHLELAYDGNRAPLGFQAVRWAGVDIFVRNLSDTSATPVQ